MSKHTHTYLALGDSYTIGDSLPLYDSFPYQLVQLLRDRGHHFHAPEMVAKTGWTTSELAEHLIHTRFNPQYDFVTLLIGVNNQYREEKIEDYENNFEFVLKKAIHFSAEKSQHVIVLSIPDWGVTPFAEGRDRNKIATEVDAYNTINSNLAERYHCQYLNITPGTREAENDKTLLAEDKLHPSAKEYQRWAAAAADKFKTEISK